MDCSCAQYLHSKWKLPGPHLPLDNIVDSVIEICVIGCVFVGTVFFRTGLGTPYWLCLPNSKRGKTAATLEWIFRMHTVRKPNPSPSPSAHRRFGVIQLVVCVNCVCVFFLGWVSFLTEIRIPHCHLPHCQAQTAARLVWIFRVCVHHIYTVRKLSLSSYPCTTSSTWTWSSNTMDISGGWLGILTFRSYKKWLPSLMPCNEPSEWWLVNTKPKTPSLLDFVYERGITSRPLTLDCGYLLKIIIHQHGRGNPNLPPITQQDLGNLMGSRDARNAAVHAK